MKNQFVKKMAAVTMAASMVMGTGLTAFAADEMTNDELVTETYNQVLAGETVTFDDASDLARLVQLGYSTVQSAGPISITQGTMESTSTTWYGRKTTSTEDVYVVCFSGTDPDVENQTTGYWTDLLVGFEQDNRYIENIRAAVTATIPEGANIIFAGHSLGGMVAQQAASDDTIKSSYNVLNTVTFGSPLINGFRREGTVKRLGDTSDVVPYMSLSSFTNIIWQSAGLNKEDGGYGTNLLGAHCESYQRESVWGAYDITGTKNGNATVTLDFSTLQFFASPVTVTE